MNKIIDVFNLNLNLKFKFRAMVGSHLYETRLSQDGIFEFIVFWTALKFYLDFNLKQW